MSFRKNLLAGVLAITVAGAQAATITTFGALDALTPDDSFIVGTFTDPGSGVDQQDVTFEFTFTTPTDFSSLSGPYALVELGGNNGSSLVFEVDAGVGTLIFRSGVSGGALMYVQTVGLNTGTQYNVVGSLFNSPTNSGDYMRLYLNQADAVNPAATFHDPDDTVNDFWGGDGGAYGVDGGGNWQNGNTVGSGTGSHLAYSATGDGTLDSNLDFFYNTYLDAAAVPEPSVAGLFAACLVFGSFVRRRRS